MNKSGWTIVGLGVSFVIIQACGDAMGTGMIVTPGATSAPPLATQQSPQPPPTMMTYETADGGWPDYEYDDGGVYWDGGASIVLEAWHWNQGVSNHRGENGQRFLVQCIAMGSDYAVWGSSPYTDDSPVCSAGAHLGLITRERGGDVTIEIRPAQRSFVGLTQNGVASFSWGPYPGSYRVIAP